MEKRKRVEIGGGGLAEHERELLKTLSGQIRTGEARRALANEFVNFSSTTI